jgi:HD-like signal output (HDOD) protein
MNYLEGLADRYDVSPSTLHRVSFRDLAMRSLDQLPPFSPVLSHLMASLEEEDVSFAKLAGVIERDTVLSGNVLRLVNSALYGRRGTVSSVRAAVSILGLAKLRNFLLGLSVSRLWAKVQTPSGWSMTKFNDHAVAVAVLSDSIVQKVRVDYPEGAFVAGLLHDLGRLMIAISLPEEFERIAELQRSSGKQIEVCEQELLDVTHSELSAAALSRWNIPSPIQKAVLYHHRAQLDPARGGPGVFALSRALSVANEIANSQGHSITGEEAQSARPPRVALADLGLDESEEEVLAGFLTEMQAIRSNL